MLFQGIILGYVDNRLRYDVSKTKKMEQSEKNSSLKTIQSSSNENANGLDDDAMHDLINTMKGILVNDEKNIQILKDNLRVTREYRRKILYDKNIDLLEKFPYFFVNTDLVSQEPRSRC